MRVPEKTLEDLIDKAAEALKYANWNDAYAAKAQRAIDEWQIKKRNAEQAAAALREEYEWCVKEIQRRKEG